MKLVKSKRLVQHVTSHEKPRPAIWVYNRSATIKIRIIGPCAMQSEISFSGKGVKNTLKIGPTETGKKKKTPDHTKRGRSNVLAHGPVVRVLTAWAAGFLPPTVVPPSLCK